MNGRDIIILQKIVNYCKEITQTHAYFNDDKSLFYDKGRGFLRYCVGDIQAGYCSAAKQH